MSISIANPYFPIHQRHVLIVTTSYFYQIPWDRIARHENRLGNKLFSCCKFWDCFSVWHVITWFVHKIKLILFFMLLSHKYSSTTITPNSKYYTMKIYELLLNFISDGRDKITKKAVPFFYFQNKIAFNKP